MAIKIKSRGSFDKSEKFLVKAKDKNYRPLLENFARQGVLALQQATPEDTGQTANSWDFQIVNTRGGHKIIWTNSNVVDGIPVVILIQYGHGTRSGSFVEGRDFINPAIRPIFDKISDELWKEVTSL